MPGKETGRAEITDAAANARLVAGKDGGGERAASDLHQSRRALSMQRQPRYVGKASGRLRGLAGRLARRIGCEGTGGAGAASSETKGEVSGVNSET